MKFLNKNIFGFLVGFLAVISVRSQESNHKIMVLGRSSNSNKIMIRWAPSTPVSFRKLNKHGYRLKRYTISISDKVLPKPIEKDLGVFTAVSQDQWEAAIDNNNNNAAIMAQSLFGDRFEVSGGNNMQGIINLSKEQQQRFTWGLYAADQDFEVAKMAGLGYEDLEVRSNEKYLYKVFPLVPNTDLKIDYGIVYLGLQDFKPLPKPLYLLANFSDQRVELSWDYDILSKIYNSYFIERSVDSLSFKPLNDIPYTTLNSSNKSNPKRIYYNDSISNGQQYFYRVRGKNAFGEIGPPSEVIGGKAKKKEVLKYIPKLNYKDVINNEKDVLLKWEYPKEGEKDIKEFQLNHSVTANGKYKKVITGIAPSKREILYKNIKFSNYFTLSAIGKGGTGVESFPILVQPVDSIPPVKPIGLEGKIDSLGVVTLKWIPNKEIDMLGYRVFKGNNKKEEFSQLTVSPHTGTTYFDKVAVKTLNDEVYYKIVAVDRRFNMSPYSQILALKRPDVIPPSAPKINTYEVKKSKVYLKFKTSQSKDVVSHEVYRRVKGSYKWNLLATILKIKTPNKTAVYVDKNVKSGSIYEYSILAVDDVNLKSTHQKPLRIEIPNFQQKPAVKNVSSYVDKQQGYLEIFWKKYDDPNVAEIMIYKGLKGKKVSLFKNVLSNVNSIIDYKIKPNNIYTYLLRPVFKNGQFGKHKFIEVKY